MTQVKSHSRIQHYGVWGKSCLKGAGQESREGAQPSSLLTDQQLPRNLGIPKDRNIMMLLTPLGQERPLDSRSNRKLEYIMEKAGHIRLQTWKEKSFQNVG